MFEGVSFLRPLVAAILVIVAAITLVIFLGLFFPHGLPAH